MPLDHFVSRFYLERFTELATPQGKKPRLWVHLARLKKWKLLPPSGVGAETDYYTVTSEDGTKHRQIERALSGVEGRAAPVIRDKIAARKNLSEQDRAHFALFVTTMMERVPATLDNLGGVHEKVFRLWRLQQIGIWRDRPEQFKKAVEQRRREFGPESLPADPSPEDLLPAEGSVKVQKGSLARTTLTVASEIAPFIAGMKWGFLFASPPDSFITSDHPVCMVDPTNTSTFYGSGLASQKIEVTFPLGRDLAFLATHQGPPLAYGNATSELVELFNYRAARYAARFIAGPSRIFPGSTALLKGL